MSHRRGGDDGGGVAEPNLTPLLDLVLQLLMFFIMCVNFVTGQTSADVKLSVSDSAMPLEKSDIERLFINLKALQTPSGRDWLDKQPAKNNPDKFRGKGNDRPRHKVAVLIFGREPMTLLEARAWLKKLYEDAETKAKVKGEEVRTVIHIRPDGDLEYEQYFEVLEAIKVSGYKKLKVHAVIGGGGK